MANKRMHHSPFKLTRFPCTACQAGVASDTLASLAVGVTNLLGTIVAGAIIEKSGRTVLLKNSYIGQGLAMFFMAAGFSLPALQVREHCPGHEHQRIQCFRNDVTLADAVLFYWL